MGEDIEKWTWEVCVYHINQTILDELVKIQAGAKYLFHEKDYGAVLGKMLNNKVDTAYQMLMSGRTFIMPKYVEDAIT